MHRPSKTIRRAATKFKKLSRLNRLIDDNKGRAQEAHKELKKMSDQWDNASAGVGKYWIKKNSKPGVLYDVYVK